MKFPNTCLSSTLIVLAVFFSCAVAIAAAVEPARGPQANYARPFEPATRPAFIPLPPGALEPAGWNPAPESPALPDHPLARQQAPERIKLVPHGCTKFRISMFPITAPHQPSPTKAPRRS